MLSSFTTVSGICPKTDAGIFVVKTFKRDLCGIRGLRKARSIQRCKPVWVPIARALPAWHNNIPGLAAPLREGAHEGKLRDQSGHNNLPEIWGRHLPARGDRLCEGQKTVVIEQSATALLTIGLCREIHHDTHGKRLGAGRSRPKPNVPNPVVSIGAGRLADSAACGGAARAGVAGYVYDRFYDARVAC